MREYDIIEKGVGDVIEGWLPISPHDGGGRGRIDRLPKNSGDGGSDQ